MERSFTLFYLVLVLLVLSDFRTSANVLKRRRKTEEVKTINNLEDIWKKEANRMRSYENRSADPCEDFYEYACGNYKNILENPDGYFNSVTSMLTVTMYEKISQLLSKNFEEGSAEQKAKTFYDLCNNYKSSLSTYMELVHYINETGLLDAIDLRLASDEYNWLIHAAELQLLGQPTLIEAGFEKSSKSDEIVLYIGSVSPSNLMFVDTEDEDSVIVKEFIKKVEKYFKVLKLLGVDKVNSSSDAQKLVNFEKGRVQIFGEYDNDLPLEFVERNFSVFKSQYPGYDWDSYIKTLLGYPLEDSYTVATTDDLRPVLEYVSTTDAENLAKYLLYNAVESLAIILADLDPRLCGIELSSHMPQVLTSLYVKEFYNMKNREEIGNMVHQLNESTWNLINNVEWLDSETRMGAKDKLRYMRILNGYIDEITDSDWLKKYFENLQFNGKRYIDNLVTLRRHYYRKEFNTAQSEDSFLYTTDLFNFNAFYYSTENIMVVPAGAQVLPAFDYNMPKWFNYGALGSLLGHELIHAFDSSGRKYDARGIVRNWWSPSANRIYTESTKCFEEKYSTYRFSKNISAFVDGKATLDENIADNVGIKVAYNAYNNWLAENPNILEPTLPGNTLTNRQSFFLAYAQLWCEYVKPSNYVKAVRDDEHSPQKFRVIGSLSNFEEFANQFQCPEGSGMNPVHKCKIW